VGEGGIGVLKMPHFEMSYLPEDSPSPDQMHAISRAAGFVRRYAEGDASCVLDEIEEMLDNFDGKQSKLQLGHLLMALIFVGMRLCEPSTPENMSNQEYLEWIETQAAFDAATRRYNGE
jgi:hypothetical protein